MLTVVRVKLRTQPEQKLALRNMLTACNRAASYVSERAFELGAINKRVSALQLQKRTYYDVKAMGLSAQPSIHVIRKVAGSYATLRSNLRNGNLGKVGSKKHRKATGKAIQFRDMGAQPFDDRSLSWQPDRQTISILTMNGRLKAIPYTGRQEDLNAIRDRRRGETDLVEHQGEFYLVATVEEEPPALFKPRGFIGVDLGITNIASTSDGAIISGEHVTRVREKNSRLRQRLQKKGTKSAKRLLKKRSQKEARFAKNVNHTISKQVVAEAVRTRRGIGLENLTGIRSRARLRKPQRTRLHSWAFAQLGAFISYKAERAGVPVVHVNPAYTSQRCSAPGCGYIDRKNRPRQEVFACQKCGITLHADTNAGMNISWLAEQNWGAINHPDAASNPAASRASAANSAL